jgi:diacylglycerol kinase family enzyme
VLVAPTVSVGPRERLRAALARASDTRGIAVEVLDLPAADRLAEVIGELLARGAECVAAAGGDGTVAAVAQVLAGGGVPLGIVPLGTGNLVARELGIPLEAERAAELLAGPSTRRRLDVMRINGRIHLLNAGVGINAEVIDRTSRLGKNLFGVSAYVGTAVWKVMQARPQRMEIVIDGVAAVYDATDVLISNCGILARGLYPNGPDIRADDGRLDVCVVCMKRPLEYPWSYVMRLLRPRNVNRVLHERAAACAVTVRSARPLAVQADGDIIGVTPVTVEILPHALSVIVP